MFDKALFRPTLKPLNQDELYVLAQENNSGSGSVVHVHPGIEYSRWYVRDAGGTIYNFNTGFNNDASVLDTLDVRNESATCPAVHRIEVVIRLYRAYRDARVLFHEGSVIIEHEASDAEGRGTITVAELARPLFNRDVQSKNGRPGIGDPGIFFSPPVPDGIDRVSAKLLQDGSVVVTQDIDEWMYDFDEHDYALWYSDSSGSL
ncbi:hypothetical protein CF326_g9906 [Tilletia indica]|nr:hypothetical protein CF326_g9906 [Tilletia indica]